MISVDSSNTAGEVFYHSAAWIWRNWALDWSNVVTAHINVKDLAMVDYSIEAWRLYHPNCHFIVQTDNMSMVQRISKGSSRLGSLQQS